MNQKKSIISSNTLNVDPDFHIEYIVKKHLVKIKADTFQYFKYGYFENIDDVLNYIYRQNVLRKQYDWEDIVDACEFLSVEQKEYFKLKYV